MKIGFIGLGNIGAPMAPKVLEAGHDLTVHNRTPAKTEPLAGREAHAA